VRLKTEQSYYQTEDPKARTPDGKQAKGSMAMEKINLLIDAVDSGAQPGNQVSRFKEAIANVPYFQSNLEKTNGVRLTSLSAPMAGVGRNPYVMFTLQCYFPEKAR